MKPDSLRCRLCGRINWAAAPRLHEVYVLLSGSPAATRAVADALGWSIQATSNALARLAELGVVRGDDRPLSGLKGRTGKTWTVTAPLPPPGVILDVTEAAGWHYYTVTLAGVEIARGGPFDSRSDVSAALAVLSLVDDTLAPVRGGGRKS